MCAGVHVSLSRQMNACSSEQIQGLSCMRANLRTLSIHHSTESMMVGHLLLATGFCDALKPSYPSGCLQSILVPEAKEFSEWEAEGEMSERPITAVIPAWRTLTTLDMSHNSISTIDRSVVRTLSLPLACLCSKLPHPQIIFQSILHHLHPEEE